MKLKKVILSSLLAVSCAFSFAGCGNKAPSGNIGDEVVFSDGDKLAEIVIEDYGSIYVKLFPDIAPKGVENFIKLAEKGYYDGLTIHKAVKDMYIQGGSQNGDGTGGAALVDESGVFPIETSTDARNFYGAVGYAPSEDGDNATQFYIINCKKREDITQYSPELIRNEATTIAEQEEGMEDTDPDLAILKYEEAKRTNLAEMLEKASDAVKTKYAETTGGYPLWDGSATVFGQVYDGFDVLDKLSGVEVIVGSDGTKSKPKTDIIIETVKITEYKTPEPEPESAESTKKKK